MRHSPVERCQRATSALLSLSKLNETLPVGADTGAGFAGAEIEDFFEEGVKKSRAAFDDNKFEIFSKALGNLAASSPGGISGLLNISAAGETILSKKEVASIFPDSESILSLSERLIISDEEAGAETEAIARGSFSIALIRLPEKSACAPPKKTTGISSAIKTTLAVKRNKNEETEKSERKAHKYFFRLIMR